MSTESASGATFDRGAAVTRSLLGWGAVVGPFYLIVGLIQAFTVDGFDITSHALSLLMLGPHGWIQNANLILSGIMVAAAAVGFARVMPTVRPWAGRLLGIYGMCLIASGIFEPDPMDGFPVGSAAPDTLSTSGILHLAFGAVGFFALAIAALLVGRWFRSIGRDNTISLSAAAIILIGFVGGAALATTAVGIALLWVAVIAGWAWLLVASVRSYGIAPHPNCA